jgi:hypothetical protein
MPRVIFPWRYAFLCFSRTAELVIKKLKDRKMIPRINPLEGNNQAKINKITRRNNKMGVECFLKKVVMLCP